MRLSARSNLYAASNRFSGSAFNISCRLTPGTPRPADSGEINRRRRGSLMNRGIILAMKSGARIFVIGQLAAFAAWAVCAALGIAGQRKLFYEEGQKEMYDFWMPRMCVEQGYAQMKSSDCGIDPKSDGVRANKHAVGEFVEFSDWYRTKDGLKFVTGDMDKVYPALALLPYMPFPATRTGAWWFSGLCAVVFLATIILISRSQAAPCLVMLSMPFMFALERGNPVWISAAAVGVFLAWWDDERDWKRCVAAICLAVAAVLKIAPAALGLLYLLGRRDLGVVGRARIPCRAAFGGRTREIVIAVVAAAILFFVPWLFLKEGFAALPIMIGNAAHHADFVLRTSDFGFVQVWRTVRVALGLDVQSPWTGMYPVARLSQLFGLVALIVGARRRDYLLLVGGMLLAAGNMYYYGALYLLPVFVLEIGECFQTARPESAPYPVRRILWFVILCPLQIVVLGHSGNAVLANLAMMTLMILHAGTAFCRKLECQC